MNKLLYIQYDQSSNNLIAITSDDKSNDSSWTLVAVPNNRKEYITTHYSEVKYDPTKQALIYPDTVVNNTELINDNSSFLDELDAQSKANQSDISNLKYKTAWNHLMQIFQLPDDLDFLNKVYGILIDVNNAKVVNFNKTGTYVLLAWGSLKLSDAPANTDYTKGCFFTVYRMGDNFIYVRFTNSNGTYIAQFANGGNVSDWKQVEIF